jgi:hypothetical protein
MGNVHPDSSDAMLPLAVAIESATDKGSTDLIYAPQPAGSGRCD